MNREEIIAANPLLEYCEARGWELRRDRAQWKCLCPLHAEQTPSFTINPAKNVWKCFGCGTGGSVIDLHAQLHGIMIGEAMRQLAGQDGGNTSNGDGKERKVEACRPVNTASARSEAPIEAAAYDYQDATGRVIYQVVRFEPKDFRQCAIVDGKRVWSMDGVERLLYHLPELLGHPASVWIVEGEKDVETLRAAGQTATCNPGGAGRWLPAFSEQLRGKCIYLAPDNDAPGRKHMLEVLNSLAGRVEWVRWVELPREHNNKPIKDVTDLRKVHDGAEAFLETLLTLQRRSRLIERGIESRFKTMAELEAQYIAGLALRGICAVRLQLDAGARSPPVAGGRPVGNCRGHRPTQDGNAAEHFCLQFRFAGCDLLARTRGRSDLRAVGWDCYRNRH